MYPASRRAERREKISGFKTISLEALFSTVLDGDPQSLPYLISKSKKCTRRHRKKSYGAINESEYIESNTDGVLILNEDVEKSLREQAHIDPLSHQFDCILKSYEYGESFISLRKYLSLSFNLKLLVYCGLSLSFTLSISIISFK